MQVEHEEHSPPEEKRSRDKTGTPQAQTPFAAPVLLEDPVKTRSMEQGEKDQNERTDAERRDRLVFVRDLSQECRNINPAVPRAVSHGSTS
jgi:hypothetical protein